MGIQDFQNEYDELKQKMDAFNKKLKVNGYDIVDDKVINTKEQIYVMEVYWDKQGGYELSGNSKTQHSMNLISKELFEKVLKACEEDLRQFISDIYDYQCDWFNVGWDAGYEIQYADSGEDFADEITEHSISKDNIYIQFRKGKGSYDNWGGYIRFKAISMKEFKDFKPVDIDVRRR